MRTRSASSVLLLLLAFALALAPAASAQPPGVTLPPSGDNQRTVLSQQIGPVEVTIAYSSADIAGPGGVSSDTYPHEIRRDLLLRVPSPLPV